MWRTYEHRYGIDSGVPAWAIGPVCVLGFVVPAMVGLWLVHRGIHQRLKLGETLVDNGVVGWFFSGVLTIYGITLGLIAVTTWESSSRVADIASREAATIAALYRDTSGFPSPLREELRWKLREYTRFVIEKAWPAQRRGEILSDGNRLLDEFQRQLFVNEPNTEGLRILQAEALKTYNELVELRRQRTDAVNQGVPSVDLGGHLVGRRAGDCDVVLFSGATIPISSAADDGPGHDDRLLGVPDCGA